MAALPKPGDTFEGRYRIESVLGKGGFGSVYLASQTDLDRQVALKVMRSPRQLVVGDVEDASDLSDRTEEFSARFQQEANLVSQLRDPHTVRMYDYGQTREGLLYMVLEYIDGVSLHQMRKENAGPLAPRRVVKIVRQILSSLHEAHSVGVLHRDIKPGNVMVYDHVGRTDLVKVLDFGLAKAVRKSGPLSESDLTHSGILIGTPRYMSPEQIRGEELGPPSDLYGVGLIAYELLAGTRAVTAETPMVIVSVHLGPDPLKLPEDLEIPGRLREIVEQLLHKNASMRFQTADEVLNALEDWDDEATQPDPTLRGDDLLDGLDDHGIADIEIDDFVEERSRRRWTGWAALLLVLLLAGGGVYGWTTSTQNEGRDSEVTTTADPENVAVAREKERQDPEEPATEPAPVVADAEEPSRAAAVALGEQVTAASRRVLEAAGEAEDQPTRRARKTRRRREVARRDANPPSPTRRRKGQAKEDEQPNEEQTEDDKKLNVVPLE